ncbi:MAG TPA: hypothetical protein VD884_17205 [Ohtaekwangia sp.]|nr:hypothetical protein [Ohtaekwangia sp.]
MKKVMFAFAAMLGAVAVNAQTTPETNPSTEVVTPAPTPDADAAEQVEIKTEELPEAVKKTLEDQEYKGWLINTARHDKKNDQYEVELKNGADTQVIKFSKDGQRLDD